MAVGRRLKYVIYLCIMVITGIIIQTAHFRGIFKPKEELKIRNVNLTQRDNKKLDKIYAALRNETKTELNRTQSSLHPSKPFHKNESKTSYINHPDVIKEKPWVSINRTKVTPTKNKNIQEDFPSDTPSQYLDQYSEYCTNKSYSNVRNNYNISLPICSCVPDTLLGAQEVLTEDVTGKEDIIPNTFMNSNIQLGGYWKPEHCHSPDRVSIVIPFRDREKHLKIFLKHIHPFLQRQQLEYRIFVIEQLTPQIFNKASLMNAGFLEARKLFKFDCIIFHDVDMIPEDDRNFYTCLHSPRHLSPYISKFDYRVMYEYLIGGAMLFKPQEFIQVNGYSNMYYGWGGEDDDMFYRLRSWKMKIHRYVNPVGRYTMIEHHRDKRNPINQNRRNFLHVNKDHYRQEGLNSVKYHIKSIENRPFYTLVRVELPKMVDVLSKVVDNR